MAKSEETIVIRKYANRRLYRPGTSTYVTLRDLTRMVKSGKDFAVYDIKTDEDLTRSVLTQILLEQANSGGQTQLPITLLRQLICFYGDSTRVRVPRYLKVSVESLAREQGKSRQRLRADRIKRRLRKSVKGR
jgi:polyhydroxyalkanoate synthesis repressor PhaR